MNDGKTKKTRPVAKSGEPKNEVREAANGARARLSERWAAEAKAAKGRGPIKATLRVRAAVITCEGDAGDIREALEGARGILAIVLGEGGAR